MNLNFFGTKINISFLFVALIATMLLINEKLIVYMGLISCIIHEMSHLIMYRFFCKKPTQIHFELTGIRLINNNAIISYKKEIIILFSGAASNFLLSSLCFLTNKFLIFGFINLFIGLFNLLPIGKLDGGRILTLILNHFQKSIIYKRIISTFFAIIILAFFVAEICLNTRNITMLIIGAYIFSMIIISQE